MSLVEELEYEAGTGETFRNTPIEGKVVYKNLWVASIVKEEDIYFVVMHLPTRKTVQRSTEVTTLELGKVTAAKMVREWLRHVKDDGNLDVLLDGEVVNQTPLKII